MPNHKNVERKDKEALSLEKGLFTPGVCALFAKYHRCNPNGLLFCGIDFVLSCFTY